MVFTSNEVTFTKNEDDSYKILAGLDVYDNEDNLMPDEHRILQLDKVELTEEKIEIFNQYKTFEFDLWDKETTIKYRNKIQ